MAGTKVTVDALQDKSTVKKLTVDALKPTSQTQSTAGSALFGIANKEEPNNNKNTTGEILKSSAKNLLQSLGVGVTSGIDNISDALSSMQYGQDAKYSQESEKYSAARKATQSEQKYKKATEKHLLGDNVDAWQNTVRNDRLTIAQDNPDSKLAKAAEWTGGLAEAAGQMLPSIAATLVTGGLGAASMAATAAGLGVMGMNVYDQSFDDSIKQGYDATSAGEKALGDAVLETATELMFGGIAGLGKGVISATSVGKLASSTAAKEATKKIGVKKTINTLATSMVKTLEAAEQKNVKGLILRGVGEGIEEMVSEIAGPVIERATTNPDADDATMKDILLAGLGGAVLSFAMSPLGNIETQINQARIAASDNYRQNMKQNDAEWQIAMMRNIANDTIIGEEDTQIAKAQLGIEGDAVDANGNALTNMLHGIKDVNRQRIANKYITEAEQTNTPEARAFAWQKLKEQYDADLLERTEKADTERYENAEAKKIIESDSKVAKQTATIKSIEQELGKAKAEMDSLATNVLDDPTRENQSDAYKAAEVKYKDLVAKQSEAQLKLEELKSDITKKTKTNNQREANKTLYGEDTVQEFERAQRVADIAQGRIVVTDAQGNMDVVTKSQLRSAKVTELFSAKYGEDVTEAQLTGAEKAKVTKAVNNQFDEYQKEVRQELENFVARVNEAKGESKINLRLTTKDTEGDKALTQGNTIFMNANMITSEEGARYYLSHEMLHALERVYLSETDKQAFRQTIQNAMSGLGYDFNGWYAIIYKSYSSREAKQNNHAKDAKQRGLTGKEATEYVKGCLSTETEEEVYARFMQTLLGSQNVMEAVGTVDPDLLSVAEAQLRKSSVRKVSRSVWDYARLKAIDQMSIAKVRPIDVASVQEELKQAEAETLDAIVAEAPVEVAKPTQEIKANMAEVVHNAEPDNLENLAKQIEEYDRMNNANFADDILDLYIDVQDISDAEYAREYKPMYGDRFSTREEFSDYLVQLIKDADLATESRDHLFDKFIELGSNERMAFADINDLETPYIDPRDKMYSSAERVIIQMSDKAWKSATGKNMTSAMTQYLKSKGVKEDEIKFSGIIPLLERVKENSLRSGGEFNKDLALLMLRFDRSGVLEEIEAGETDTNFAAYPGYGINYTGRNINTVGGTNRRSFLYRTNGVDYTSPHWIGGVANGLIVHVRTSDFDTAEGKALLIEEIQSDLYNDKGKQNKRRKTLAKFKAENPDALEKNEEFKKRISNITFDEFYFEGAKYDKAKADLDYFMQVVHTMGEKYGFDYIQTDREYMRITPATVDSMLPEQILELAAPFFTDSGVSASDSAIGRNAYDTLDKSLKDYKKSIGGAAAYLPREYYDLLNEQELFEDAFIYTDENGKKKNSLKEARDAIVDIAINQWIDDVDAPYENTYTDYALQRMIQRAIDEGYNYLAWTTPEMQEVRWSSDYAKGYQIEYGQDIPNFLKRYAKQWNGRPSTIDLSTGDIAEKGELYGFYPGFLEKYSEMLRSGFDVDEIGTTQDIRAQNFANASEALNYGNVFDSLRLAYPGINNEQLIFERCFRDLGIEAERVDGGFMDANTGEILIDYEPSELIRDSIVTDAIYPPETITVPAVKITDEMRESIPKTGQKRWAFTDIEETYELTGERLKEYEELMAKYGAYDSQGKSSKTVGLPTQTDTNMATNRFANQLYTQTSTPDDLKNLCQNMLLDGGLSHLIISDAHTMRYVESRLRGVEQIKEKKRKRGRYNNNGEYVEGEIEPEEMTLGYSLSNAYADATSLLKNNRSMDKNELAYCQQVLVEILGQIETVKTYNEAHPDNQTSTDQLYDMFEQLLANLSAAGTRSGQNLQAFSLLKKMTPTGRLYYIDSQVGMLLAELNKKNGKQFIIDATGSSNIDGYRYIRDPKTGKVMYKDGKPVELKVSEELKERFMNASTLEELDALEEEAIKEIAAQIPPSLQDRVTSWRYLAMLGNPRTHIRNIVSNVAMGSAVKVKNRIGGALEDLFISEEASEYGGRQKTLKHIDPELKASLKEFAENDWTNDGMSEVALTGSKVGFQSRIDQERQKMKIGLLDKAGKANSNLLEAEDDWSGKRAYKEAFVVYCAANGLTPEILSAGTTASNVKLAQARNYACTEAAKATYHDANEVATLLNKLEKQGKVYELILGGLVPFKKTPANILKRGLNYSPIGLVSGLTKAVQLKRTSVEDFADPKVVANMKSKLTQGIISKEQYDKAIRESNSMNAYSKIDAEKLNKADSRFNAQAQRTLAVATAIDQIAAGLTGTGLMLIGLLLSRLGLMKGSGSDKDREEYYDQMLGYQKYSITINGENYTLDWLTPVSMPLFAGVELYDYMKDGIEELSFSDIASAVFKTVDPVMNLSLLQGINDAMGSYDTGLGKMALSSVESFAGQFIPTFAGQVARTIDPVRRTTYAQKDEGKEFAKEIGTFVNRMENKIPGLSQKNSAYVDMWGRNEVSDKSVIGRFLENAVFPFYTEDINVTPVDDYLSALFEYTGENTVLPTTPDSYNTVAGVNYYLTPQEYETTKELVGQISYEGINSLIEYPDFANLTPEQQATIVGQVYSLASRAAKEDYYNANGIVYDPDTKLQKITYLVENGMTLGKSMYVYYMIGQFETDKDKNGNPINGSKKEKVVDFCRTQGLTNEQIVMITGYKLS